MNIIIVTAFNILPLTAFVSYFFSLESVPIEYDQFLSFDNALKIDLFQALQIQCDTVQKWIVKQDFSTKLKHGKLQTFWMPIVRGGNATPRFAIEEAIFNLHNVDKSWFGGKRVVGAEWWVQVKGPRDSIGFHYDKDEGEASTKGVMKHPLLSTITYLTDNGSPTVIFNMTTDGNFDAPTIPTTAYISFPKRNRHTIFRCNFLLYP